MNKITQAYKEGMEEFRTKQENGDFGNPHLDADRIEKYFATFARKLILATKDSMPEEAKRPDFSFTEALESGNNGDIADASFKTAFNLARTAALAPLDEFLEAIK